MGSPVVKGALRAGAIAGIAVWYLALVGMLGRLADLPIIGTSLTMDQLLIFLPAALAGWFAVRPRVVAGEIRTPSSKAAVAAGAATGLAAGIVVGLGLGAVNMIGVETVRTVFPSVSPELMNELYLGYAPVVGTVILVIGMTGLAAISAGLRSVPATVHRPIVAGLAAIVATALLEQVIAPAFNQMSIEKDWLYNTKAGGLEWIGAVIVFIVVAAAVRFRVGPKLRNILLPGRSTSTPASTRTCRDRAATIPTAPDGDDRPIESTPRHGTRWSEANARGAPDHRVARDRR